MLNNIDKAINELKIKPEDLYEQFVKQIDSINNIISKYSTNIILGLW